MGQETYIEVTHIDLIVSVHHSGEVSSLLAATIPSSMLMLAAQAVLVVTIGSSLRGGDVSSPTATGPQVAL